MPVEKLAVEARTSRLHLGEGAIPLHEILDLLPQRFNWSSRRPLQPKPARLTLERAKSAARHTVDFFRAHASRAGASTAPIGRPTQPSQATETHDFPYATPVPMPSTLFRWRREAHSLAP